MYEQMIRWSIYILVGALGSMLNNLIFGVVSERIGNSLRKRLFEKLIYLGYQIIRPAQEYEAAYRAYERAISGNSQTAE